MKAINCSQCGALIRRVRIRDKFAECEYCHSTTQILREKIIYVQDKPKPKLKKLTEQEQKSVLQSFDSDDEIPFLDDATKNSIIVVLLVIAGIIITFLLAYYSNE